METTIPGDFRLTIGQRFFAHRFEMWPNSSRPNQRMYRLNDDFNYGAFVKAVQHTIDSHAGLRIRLFREKDEWRQYFPNQKANVVGEVLNGPKPDQCLSYAKKVIIEEAYRPLDLKYECPIKAKVINVNEQYWLSLCGDHMAIDEIGFNLLEKEIEKAYRIIVSEKILPEVSQEPYINYLKKEETRKATEERNLIYWQEQLKGAPMLIDTFNNGHVHANYYVYELTGEHYSILLDFCKRSKFSLFNILTAAHLLVMAESGKKSDLTLSFVIANRFNPEEQNLIINLVMLLHVRFFVKQDEPLAELLTRVRETSIAALIHRNYDYASLYRIMAAEARQNGCFPNLGRECNLIVDDDPLQFPNSLFMERMEEKPKGNFQTMKTGFSIYAQQTPKKLSVNVTWDPSTWAITNEEMAVRFPLLINQFMD